MRLGLIGLGRIGAFHAETLAGLPDVDELVVTDVVPSLVDEIVAKFGAVAVDSPAAVLASKVDGVIIASPTPTHPDLILAALEAGVPAFCEKPVALDPRHAGDLLHADDTSVPVQVGFPRRFDPGFLAAKAELETGRLGWLHTVRSTTFDPAPPSAAYIAQSGGIFRDCAIHDYDAVRWITGREVVEVYAVGASRGADYIADAGDADTATAVLTMDDGAIAVVSNSRHNGHGHDVRMELHGSEQTMIAGLADYLPARSADPGVAFPTGVPADFFMDRFAAAFRAELTAFTEVIGGRPSPCTIRDAVESSWVAEAATLSRLEHRPVRVDEVKR